MCLITDQKVPTIATEDIIVYKVLQLPYSEKGLLVSPYNIFYYKLGELYETKIEKSNERCCLDNTDDRALSNKFGEWKTNEDIISYGPGFHSMKTYERAVQCSKSMLYVSTAIYKCTIPKGAEYYENPSDLLVSDKLIVVKRCTE